MNSHTTGRAAADSNPRGLAEWLCRRAKRSGANPALTFQGETWDYRELQRRIEALSAVFAALGAGYETRIGWLGFNHPLTIVAMFAANRIGAIFVPLNYRLSPREIAECMEDAGIHTIVADATHAHLVDAVRETVPTVCYLVPGDAAPAGWQALDHLLAEAPPSAPKAGGEPDDVAVIAFTSGTTGRSKGAMITNGNIFETNINWSLSHQYSSGDVALVWSPFFHVGGLFVNLTPTLLWGGHVVIQQHFDPLDFMRAVETYRVTVSFLVPATMLMISQHEAFDGADFSSLRLIVQGSAPVPRPLLALCNERGIPVSHCYGMTESTGAATLLETHEAIDRLGSCGRPGMLADIRIIDADGRPVTQAGQRGEVCIRGGMVMKGYWNLPEATRAAIDEDGWLRSGDVGYFDEDGYLYISDRIKDMLISGGENVYPAELESVFHAHPAIAEAAVIGAPDKKWGERVVVIAALKPHASLTLEDLRDFCEGRLARYKLPRELHIVEALPRNANGKIQKGELRTRFASR